MGLGISCIASSSLGGQEEKIPETASVVGKITRRCCSDWLQLQMFQNNEQNRCQKHITGDLTHPGQSLANSGDAFDAGFSMQSIVYFVSSTRNARRNVFGIDRKLNSALNAGVLACGISFCFGDEEGL